MMQDSRKGRRAIVMIASGLLLAGCARPSGSATPRPEPVACSDSLYVRLSAQHPDSLSEREWQRLQSLDSACAQSRHQAGTGGHTAGMMGMEGGRGGAWLVLAPVLVGAMAAVMIVLGL